MRLKDIVEDAPQPSPDPAHVLRRAEQAGFDIQSPGPSADEIIAAANSPPAFSMMVTDETSEQELMDFIRHAGRREQ